MRILTAAALTQVSGITTTHFHLPECLLYTFHKPEHKDARCRPAITRQFA